jgi:hypothetical protein
MLTPDAALFIARSLVLGVLVLFVFGWALKPARSQHVRDKVNEIFA